MRYTIIGLPASFSLSSDVVVKDLWGNIGLLSCNPVAFTVLPRSDLATIMGFYDAAADTGWWTLDELALRLFPALHAGDGPRHSSPLVSRSVTAMSTATQRT